MIKNPEFDDIRPYYDDEVASVIERLLKNPQFRQIMHFLFPEEKVKEIEQLMQTFTNQHDFQHQLMAKLVWNLLNRTDSVVTSAGFENVSPETAYTFISNHRDIVLDASILSILLADNGFETMEIAIGDNLLLTDWIKDLVRLNRSFIVKRNLQMRQMLEASKLLSKYIHFTIKDKKQSIWIAQREGRAKDSNDRTQDSVLKMLAMGNEQHFLKSMTELNLTPLTFSYEYDPCDYLKAKEFQQRIDITGFKKTQEDDLLNMRTGIFGYKGRIHLQVGHTINPALLNLDDSLNRNGLAAKTASIIDNEIFRNYKFFPVNYIAYDRLWGNNFFCEKYTPEDVKNYERYFQQQLDKIDLPNKDIPYLTGKMEEMYANPVRNQLRIEN